MCNVHCQLTVGVLAQLLRGHYATWVTTSIPAYLYYSTCMNTYKHIHHILPCLTILPSTFAGGFRSLILGGWTHQQRAWMEPGLGECVCAWHLHGLALNAFLGVLPCSCYTRLQYRRLHTGLGRCSLQQTAQSSLVAPQSPLRGTRIILSLC